MVFSFVPHSQEWYKINIFVDFEARFFDGRDAMIDDNNRQKKTGLTFRSFVVALFAIFFLAAWVQYVDRFCAGGPLAENWPPNGAVGVILIVMAISGLLFTVRRSLRLTNPELVVVYAALLAATPLVTQGLWGRMFGLLAAIPHNEDFKSYESLPKVLWPHGPNLVTNGRFEKGLEGYTCSSATPAGWMDLDWGHGKKWKAVVLNNGPEAEARSSLTIALHRTDASGHDVLVPGERMLFSMLVKADEFQKGSFYSVAIQSETGREQAVLMQTATTKPAYALPSGFQRVGAVPVQIPPDPGPTMTIQVSLTGAGRIAVTDLELINMEAIEGLYSGRKLVNEEQLSTLGPDERDFTVVKPKHMLSVAGLSFLMQGYIPLQQWVMPAIAWSLLIGALFLGFLGLNLLMARQWMVSERFSFPQTLLPKNLLAEMADGKGGVVRAILRNRIFWIGFAVAFPLAVLKGLNFYNPAVPAPIFSPVALADYFTSPMAKAFFRDVTLGGTGWNVWSVSISVLAIALLIETNVLFSLWACFLLFQLWNLFGAMFGLNRHPGYPWPFQQAMGSFIAFAFLALFMGRRHLKDVFSRVFRRTLPADSSPVAKDITLYRVALLMVLSSLVMLGGWGVWTEMGLTASLLFFGYMLVLGFASSKIRAECGAPFSYLTPYFGMQFVAAIGGFAVFGSKGMLVATIASGFMTTACFLLMAPVQVEMLELGQHFGVRRRDVMGGLSLGLLGGLFIGGFVLLCWAYGFGANRFEYTWPYEQNWYYNGFRTVELNADRAFEAGTLFSIPENQPLNFVKNVDAKGLGIGVVITVLLAVARSFFAWFPLHPLGYVLASSYFMKGFIFTAFLAWLIRVVILRVGGARRIRSGLIPFCVGMFMAAVVSVVLFDLVGIYLRTQGISNIYSAIP